MARNDLRARGGGLGGCEAPHQLGVGVARSTTPTASIDIKIICLSVRGRHVSVSTDVMFSTDEITDRDIGTKMTTGTSAHREYKWRPGHSKRK